ncbi:amino acid aminotransferase [Adhaeretor mobilis]|uniref:Aminotransferase n=1 Tax=Adhaeretor mobilis TaxID=1930276 RepID=A0A517N1V8_9BACT|nr:amino acid aminotransferase [Adhaeretor mobilis]QDT01126.1 Aspartate aminotransferase [Adhaeretor mobilis]
MLEQIEPAPADAILGLTAAFNSDPRSEKVNLSVGVYKDEHGKTPILDCVRTAATELAAEAATKSYLPIPGLVEYREAVCDLLFGSGHEVIEGKRIASAQTPGGTGALRVAGEFIKANLPGATLWHSDPTWPNHPNVFNACGLPLKKYPYFDSQNDRLDYEGMLAALKKIPAGDVVLLHGCCHNPTGVDPTGQQWTEIASVLRERGVLPLLDFAYQGFADGIEEDAAGLRAFSTEGAELMVCSSFSKNFSLYRERVGALAIVGKTAESASALQTQLNAVIRRLYSNPPAHGAEIVNKVLRSATLREQWIADVAAMRRRINNMRQGFVDGLAEAGVPGDFSFITQQRGMFSFSGLSKEQVESLRDEHAVYIVGSGRINVAGLTPTNLKYVAEAIGDVVGQAV